MPVPVVRSPAGDARMRAAGWFLMVAVLLTSGGAVASGTNADGGWQQTTIRSGSGRFFVSADAAVDRMRLSRWADDVYYRLQKVWHPAAVLPEDTVFDIIVDSEVNGWAPGAIEVRRQRRGDPLNLGLRMESVAALEDGEPFIEAVTAMILDALIIAAQPDDEGRLPEEKTPHWLSVGVAQNLYPALRIRNQKLGVDLWRSGNLPDASEVLTWRHLSPYRGFEHAVSGVWVAWATGHWTQPSDALQSWITLRAQGRSITAEHIMPSTSETRMPSDGWEPYIATLQRLFRAGDGLSAAGRYDRLRQGLQVAPGVSGIPGSVELSADDALDALIPHRREPWIGLFIRSRSNELSALAAGGGADYQELAERITGFLNALESRRLRFLLRRDYQRILREIEEQEQLAVLREQYVSLFELHYRPDPLPAWLADDGLDAAPPSRLRRYVDGFDTP